MCYVTVHTSYCWLWGLKNSLLTFQAKTESLEMSCFPVEKRSDILIAITVSDEFLGSESLPLHCIVLREQQSSGPLCCELWKLGLEKAKLKMPCILLLHRVISSFAFDLEISCLLPTSTKLSSWFVGFANMVKFYTFCSSWYIILLLHVGLFLGWYCQFMHKYAGGFAVIAIYENRV